MTDLWTEASIDHEAETEHRRLTACRLALAPHWPFLAGAQSSTDYANRKALIADRIIEAASKVADGVEAAVLAAKVEATFDADWQTAMEERQATEQRVNAHRAFLRNEARVRARVQAETERRRKIAVEGGPHCPACASDDLDVEDDVRSTFVCNSCKEVFDAQEAIGAGQVADNGKTATCKTATDLDDDSFQCSVCGKRATHFAYEEGFRASGQHLCDEHAGNEFIVGDRTVEKTSRRTASEGGSHDGTSSADSKGESSQGDAQDKHSADTPEGGDHNGPKSECPICSGNGKTSSQQVVCNSCGSETSDDTKLGAATCKSCGSSDLKRKYASKTGVSLYQQVGPGASTEVERGNPNYFRPEFIVADGSPEVWYTHGVVYPTRELAEQAGQQKADSWYSVTDWRVVSDDTPLKQPRSQTGPGKWASRRTAGKAARDLEVGDVTSQGTVSKVDKSTTPGVVYVWYGGTEPPADATLNHGDPVSMSSESRLVTGGADAVPFVSRSLTDRTAAGGDPEMAGLMGWMGSQIEKFREQGINNKGQPPVRPCSTCSAPATFDKLYASFPQGYANYTCTNRDCRRETHYVPLKPGETVPEDEGKFTGDSNQGSMFEATRKTADAYSDAMSKTGECPWCGYPGSNEGKAGDSRTCPYRADHPRVASKTAAKVRIFDESEGYWVTEDGQGATPEEQAWDAMSKNPLFCSGPGQVQVGGKTFDYGETYWGPNPKETRPTLTPSTWTPHRDMYGRESAKTALAPYLQATGENGVNYYIGPTKSVTPPRKWVHLSEVRDAGTERYRVEMRSGDTPEAAGRYAVPGRDLVIDTSQFEWYPFPYRKTPFFSSKTAASDPITVFTPRPSDPSEIVSIMDETDGHDLGPVQFSTVDEIDKHFKGGGTYITVPLSLMDDYIHSPKARENGHLFLTAQKTANVGPGYCPNCGSTNVTMTGPNLTGNPATGGTLPGQPEWSRNVCGQCGNRWTWTKETDVRNTTRTAAETVRCPGSGSVVEPFLTSTKYPTEWHVECPNCERMWEVPVHHGGSPADRLTLKEHAYPDRRWPREQSLKTAEERHSETCPNCKAHMDDVTVQGTTLVARCDECGWSGEKRRGASLHTAARHPVHEFYDTSSGYDRTQYDDNIRDGDVLHVPEEGVVGFLLQAWPVAITEAKGQFHGLKPSFLSSEDGSKYASSLTEAVALARSKGYPVESLQGMSSKTAGENPFAKKPGGESKPSGGGGALDSMAPGSQVTINYTLQDGTTGSIPGTFKANNNGTYMFDCETGEFGVTQAGSDYTDAQGTKFTFDAVEGAQPAQQAPAQQAGQGNPFAKQQSRSSLHTAARWTSSESGSGTQYRIIEDPWYGTVNEYKDRRGNTLEFQYNAHQRLDDGSYALLGSGKSLSVTEAKRAVEELLKAARQGHTASKQASDFPDFGDEPEKVPARSVGECPSCGSKNTEREGASDLACNACGYQGGPTEEDVDEFVSRYAHRRTAANPYMPAGNPYVPDQSDAPGLPEDMMDGPPDTTMRTTPAPSTTTNPTTTKPRQKPSGAPAEMNQAMPSNAPVTTPGSPGNGVTGSFGPQVPVRCMACNDVTVVPLKAISMIGVPGVEAACVKCGSDDLDLDDSSTTASLEKEAAGVRVPTRFYPGNQTPTEYLNDIFGSFSAITLEEQPDGGWAGTLLIPEHMVGLVPMEQRPASYQVAAERKDPYKPMMGEEYDGWSADHDPGRKPPISQEGHEPTTKRERDQWKQGAQFEPDMDTLKDIKGVTQQWKCSSCFNEFSTTSDGLTENYPTCPSCGSEAVTVAGGTNTHTAAFRAKVAEITEGIRATNRGMSQGQAVHLAMQTLKRYPKMARGLDDERSINNLGFDDGFLDGRSGKARGPRYDLPTYLAEYERGWMAGAEQMAWAGTLGVKQAEFDSRPITDEMALNMFPGDVGQAWRDYKADGGTMSPSEWVADWEVRRSNTPGGIIGDPWPQGPGYHDATPLPGGGYD